MGFSCVFLTHPEGFFLGRFWGLSRVLLGIQSGPIEATMQESQARRLPPATWLPAHPASLMGLGRGRGLQPRCCQLPAPCGKLILSLKEIYCIFADLSRKFRFIVHAFIFLSRKSPGLNKGCWKKKEGKKKDVLPQGKLITSPNYLIVKSSGNKSQGWLF